MGTTSGRRVSLDEPRVERRPLVACRRTPEIVVALRLQQRGDPHPGGVQVGDLDEHVDDGLGREPGDGRAAEVLDAPNQVTWQARQQVRLLARERLSPGGVVRHDVHVLGHEPSDPLLRRFSRAVHACALLRGTVRATAVDAEARLAALVTQVTGVSPAHTCWSTRIGLPSGSTATKLAGPVVLSSACCRNSTPCAFSWRCSSRTSVNEASG